MVIIAHNLQGGTLLVFSITWTLKKKGWKLNDTEKLEKYHEIKEIWKIIFCQLGQPHFWNFNCVDHDVSSQSHQYTEVVAKSFSVKKVFLEISQNSQGNTCARVSFLMKLQVLDLQLHWKTLRLWDSETLAQVFSGKFCEISKNTIFLQSSSSGCFWIYKMRHT